MYTLTIVEHDLDVRTQHATTDDAQAALHTYLVSSDYYLWPVRRTPAHTVFELIFVSETQPRVVGTATIAPYTTLDAHRDLKAMLAGCQALALAS